MFLVKYALARIDSVLIQIEGLLDLEFAYEDSSRALVAIQRILTNKRSTLSTFANESDPEVVKQVCTLALRPLFQFLPLLGLILRSTKTRNAFELVRPLRRIARALLEPGVPENECLTKLILSSEWDYSPLIYHKISNLPGFVLIGLPSSESANPLLFPLSGHELGHALWSKRNLKLEYQKLLQDKVVSILATRLEDYRKLFPHLLIEEVRNQSDLRNNILAVPSWDTAVGWAVKQSEESFCDFVGVRLFGRSYLLAFAYLVSPGDLGHRLNYYPNVLTRVRNMLMAFDSYGLKNKPESFLDEFGDRSEVHLSEADRFILGVADAALNEITGGLIKRANELVTSAGIPEVDHDKIRETRKRFDLMVPQHGCGSLSDILNAAWLAFEDQNLWKDNRQLNNKRDAVLKELVLKNIELFEVEQIQIGKRKGKGT